MFNNLRIFKLKSDYTSKKGEFEYPTCSYVEEDDWVYFMDPIPTVKSFNVTLSYSKNVIDASGGTSTPTYSFSQEVEYDNGTTKTFTGSSSQPHSEAVVSWGGASDAYGLVSADTKGTVESEQTLVASPVIRIVLNGVVATATSSVYQAANTIINTSTSGGEITYGNVIKGTISNATIPAKGSTTNYTATASNGSQTWTKSDIITTYTYTSNATKNIVEKGTSGTNVVTPSPSSLSATASTKGTVTSNTTTVTSTTVTWSGQGGKSVSDTMYVYQEANKVESSSGGEVTYGNVVPGTASASQVIPASGGSATITATKGTQSKTTASGIFHYTSEATASSSSDIVETIDVPYTISKSEVTAQTRSNVTGNQLTIESVSVTWNGNDSKKATSSVTVYQQANSCSTNIEYTYGSISKGSFSNKTIAASGGSATVSIGNGFQGRTGITISAYTSNVIETAQTVNDTVSVSPSISSLSGSANNRGTVTGTQLTITSSTVTWSANGKSARDTVYIYQEANTRSTKSVNTVYSNINVGTINANPSSVEFEGGTSYVTATNGSQTWEEITTYSYTSKEESTAVTDSGSIVVTPTVNPTELVFEALDGSEDSHCLTSVATWSANGKSATASTTVCQSSKSVTGTGITYSYGTVTAGTITNTTIPASGSSTSYSATIRSGSQNYTAYTHNYWSDGTDEIVSQTTGTTTISPSPSSLSATASTRGTTTGTQKTITSTTVTWASKDGITSKNKTATAYVYQQANEVTSTTTARTYSYGTVTAGTINTATIPASGGNGTTTIENGGQKYTAYTATTYYYTSNSSDSANTNSSSGTTAATPNRTSLTASTSSRGTTTSSAINVTSATITWTGGGSKTATGTAYVKQEANTITEYLAPTFDLWYSSGVGSSSSPAPAGGGTSSVPSYTVTQKAVYTSTSTGSVTPNVTSKSFTVSTRNTAASVTVASDGKVTFGSLGKTTQAAQSPSAIIQLTLTSNGVQGSDTAWVYQQANSSSVTYSWGSVTAGTITNATVPANGGTKSATASNGSQSYTATTSWTSTDTSAKTGTSSITPDYSSTSATGSNLGTTYKCETTLASRKVTWSGGGSKSVTGTMYVKQEANVITSLDAIASSSYSTHISYPSTAIGAGGGTATCSRHGSSQITFTSGSKTTHGSSGNYYGGTFTWSRTYKISGTGFSIDTSDGTVTAASRGTSIGAARTGTVTSVMTVSYSPTGGCGSSVSDTMSSTATVTQALNKVTSVSGTGNPSITYATIPASGGTVSPSNSGFSARFYYSSGSHGDPSGYSAQRTYSAGTGSTVLTMDSSGNVNGPDRMSTTGNSWSRTIKTTVTYSYTNPSSVGGGSVSTSITATGTVTQQANTITYNPIQVDGPSTLGYDGNSSYNKCAQFSAYMTFTYTSGDTGKTTTGFTFSSSDGHLSMTSSGYGCNMNSNYSYTNQAYTGYIDVTHSSGQEGGRTVNLEMG